MQTCSVYGCANNNPLTADSSAHYYYFPRHPVYTQQWMQACGWQSNEIDLNTSRICSLHFDNDSYTTDIKVIDYMPVYTKLLRFNAIPTLYMPTTSQLIIKDTTTNTQDEMKELIVFSVGTTADSAPPQIEQAQSNGKDYIELQVHGGNATETSTSDSSFRQEEKAKQPQINTPTHLEQLQMKNRDLKRQIDELEGDVRQMRADWTRALRLYREKDQEFDRRRQQLAKFKRGTLSMAEQKRLLSKVFSESQIKILSGKKKIYWSDDDMAVGYTIRHLSNKRCYIYLTKNLNIPLPAVSSIKRWITMKTQIRKSVEVKKEENDSD